MEAYFALRSCRPVSFYPRPAVHLAENFCPCTTGSSLFPSCELTLLPHMAQAITPKKHQCYAFEFLKATCK